mgnify:CR=1 FL=1
MPEIKKLQDIPNIGPAMERSLIILGVNKPDDLIGQDPYQMYHEICSITHKKLDLCVIDVFISAIRYMEGGPPKKWWEFTQERKAHFLSHKTFSEKI